MSDESLLGTKAILENRQAINDHRRIAAQATSSRRGDREKAERDGEQEAARLDDSIRLRHPAAASQVE